MSLVKADAVMLVRVEEGKQKHIAIIDGQSRQMFSPRDRPSFARTIFSNELDSARGGTVWLLSDIRDQMEIEAAGLAAKFREYAVRDIAVVTLDSSYRTSYYLEFHSRSVFPEHNRVLLLTLAGTLSKSWKDRSLGAARAIELSHKLAAEHAPERSKSINMLATGNPLGLSRCEFRVCLMVREGFTAKRVAKELNVSESTVRTHLSSIFAKAGVSGHVELLHRLSQKPAGNVMLGPGR